MPVKTPPRHTRDSALPGTPRTWRACRPQIVPIDLLAVNLYPFRAVAKPQVSFEDAS
jgi:hypothetical protein